MRCKLSLFAVSVLASLVVLVPVPAVATSYGTSGQAWVGVANAIPATRNTVHPVFAADSIAVDNGYGALAAATYVASLSSATLTTDVGATADPADSYFNSAAAEVNALAFWERLNVVIPAGAYTEPVVVRLYGFSLGSLYSLGCTSPAGDTCSNGYHVLSLHVGGAYGQADFNLQRSVNAGSNAATDFDALFTLDVPILNATTLTAPATSVLAVTGSLITKGTALGTYGYPAGAERTMFAGDAFAGFSAIEVPAGVGWYSDSGVFLSQPVPEPAPAVLLLAGLATLGWLLRRRRV